jgi:hypothetical protein
LPLSKHRRRLGRVAPGSSRSAASLSIDQPRRKKTNWLYLGASALIAVLVIGGFAIGSAGIGGGGFNRSGNSEEYVEGIGVQHDTLPTRNHITQGQTVEYNSIPATSGDHWAQWSRCGFFEENLPDERVVHNLEHSNIVVSYNLTTPEEVDELREVMGSVGLAGVHGVTRFYDKMEPGTVALSAWGVSDTMTGIDEDRINTFFKTYGGTLGPEGNIPCLNSGAMPLGSPHERSGGQ